MKKQKTDLDNFRKLFAGTKLKVTENLDECDFTEFTLDDVDKTVEFYFDTEGKFVGITRVTDKL